MNALNYSEATMTSEEAESIVRRLAERSTFSGGPKVGELAEALGVSTEEVARVLAEIRANPKRRVTQRERRVWLLSGLGALVLAGAAFGSMQALRFHSYNPEENASEAIATDTMSVTAAVPQDQVFRIYFDGQDTGGTIDADLDQHDAESALSDGLETWLKENVGRLPYPTATISDAQATASRQAAREERWKDVAGVHMVLLEFRRPSDSGGAMRWARAVVPIYRGDDALVAEALRAERHRLVVLAIEEAMKSIPASNVVAAAPASS